MGLQFSQVAYVADVVPDAILLDVSPAHGLAGEVLDQTDAFQHRSAVLPAPAKVVDFARPRVFQEFFKRPDDVVAVDLIADLFPFIPIYRVHLAVEANLDQVRKEAMELHAGVGRAGQTSPAKDPDSHSEIAAVFLSQDVCGRFGCSEERVQAPVNPAGFVYTVVVFGISIVIPRFQFRQRQLVGSVAVYLVGAHVDEHSIRTELPRGFEQIERADRIDFEVDDGHLARLVVGGLCGAVDNAVEPFLAKQREQSFPISDVQIHVRKIARASPQTGKIPARVSGRSEKDPAHIVVNPGDSVSLLVEIRHRLGTDETAASSNQKSHVLLTPKSFASRQGFSSTFFLTAETRSTLRPSSQMTNDQ